MAAWKSFSSLWQVAEITTFAPGQVIVICNPMLYVILNLRVLVILGPRAKINHYLGGLGKQSPS